MKHGTKFHGHLQKQRFLVTWFVMTPFDDSPRILGVRSEVEKFLCVVLALLVFFLPKVSFRLHFVSILCRGAENAPKLFCRTLVVVERMPCLMSAEALLIA